MENEDIAVSGMACDGCAASLQKRMATESGIDEVAVSYSKGTARISYDPDVIAAARIREIIVEAGFESSA